ncbi:magnesium chelatase ATPase subunit I [Roseococcus sp. SDR]|uniref:magnesium chelatase ATPase subunit I n=1 Tax=Roseococcus sp. SDR TaxID=2835532 RepID=UPI001BD049FF|nr:magnesium chelatase ATPase subunit I [Roseococcus sp. SDR]MBS7789916.1 magnesium chelatase ATPase subunit I [Roseococcus sp. SDR]MBV1845230.1 magnesium chelatase ATPase subunit I [Roseococcus sp. SDR]
MDGSIAGTRPRAGKARRKAAEPVRQRLVFPFTAIVGQEELRLSLSLCAVDPSIGGVLALGDRGTGKSTAIRALAALLPPMRAIQGCAYNCEPGKPTPGCEACARRAPKAVSVPVPVVDLPLGASEDRVVGALDLEKALAQGQKAFEPGLLARAHRGFLYIDEVNLLEDHLVDLLLDVAASGENVVERDGLSIRHPARFVLVGSGNPEEGELRPQLLDRFGLSIEVTTPSDLPTRIEVIKRRDAFERDPAGFCALWQPEEEALRARILAARDLLPRVVLPDDVLEMAAKLCMTAGTDGLRGELTLMRTARGLAAFEGATEVSLDHLRRLAPMALRHRLRRSPLDDAVATTRVARAVQEVFGP